MKNKPFCLSDIIKITHNCELSESYVRYLCGLANETKYRHQEVLDIESLLATINIDKNKLTGFIYGYLVPQLNKEFDLIKITGSCCLNIELKSDEISEKKLKRQLIQNLHYLKLLNKEYLYSFAYISSSKRVLTINSEKELVECSIYRLISVLN